ncbi:LOW QUALITY PROTEIN: Guanine nucleotide-binding protein, beta subunit [Parasponia andersonii]|uniref:Eukaryotic translation initiation factor 2A n=1 Tax=Parasponia andersonii TaxID=3476 RepID=A0A2P5DWK9_PARAD|nr:LOW QUALITY PROTEIN: Guanine nucleotide-binding protein, beta subunit [Parasponia andersonii]
MFCCPGLSPTIHALASSLVLTILRPKDVKQRRLSFDAHGFPFRSIEGLTVTPQSPANCSQSQYGNNLAFDPVHLQLAMAAVTSAPALDILVRGPEGFSIWNGPPFGNGEPGVKLETTPCTSSKFSEDGSRLMVVKSDSAISIYDCITYKEVRTFQVPNLLAAALSACGTYLQTFQKTSGPQEKNVNLWKIESGDSVYQQFQKNMTKTTWPSIRFSSIEAVAYRLATNEIQFFDAGDFSKGIVHRIRVPGVAAVELSWGPAAYVAAFVPESKGVPASVQIFTCGKDAQNQPVARKSFFRSSSVQLSWNQGSTGLLVVVQSDVDKTNQSYYGESKLNYLTTDGSYEGLVPLRKEGPVHDVQWSYTGLEFAILYATWLGFEIAGHLMCPHKMKRNENCIFVYLILSSIVLCLAGFGNLPGDMAFWDYIEKKQVGTCRAECSVSSEWSPDGCYFMTATTAPRLQIDNCIKVFHYNGTLYFKKMFDKLYQADWKPVSPDRYGDITKLIKATDTLKVGDTNPQGERPKASQTSGKSTPTNPPAAKPAAYRPPHAKNAAVVQAELFGQSPTETMSKNALKNKKKREKQKEKKAAEGTGASNGLD